MTDHRVLQVCKALPPLRRDKAQQPLDLRIGKGALRRMEISCICIAASPSRFYPV